MRLYAILLCTFHMYSVFPKSFKIDVHLSWDQKTFQFCKSDKIHFEYSSNLEWRGLDGTTTTGKRFPASDKMIITKDITMTNFISKLSMGFITIYIKALECHPRFLETTVGTYGENIYLTFAGCEIQKDGDNIMVITNFESNTYCVSGELRLMNLSTDQIGNYTYSSQTFSLQKLLVKKYVTSTDSQIDMLLNFDSLSFDPVLEDGKSAKWEVKSGNNPILIGTASTKSNGSFLLEFVAINTQFTVKRKVDELETIFTIMPRDLNPSITIEQDGTYNNREITCSIDTFPDLTLKSILLLKNGQHFYTYSDLSYKILEPIDECSDKCEYTCQFMFEYRSMVGQVEITKSAPLLKVVRKVDPSLVLTLNEKENIVLSIQRSDPPMTYCLLKSSSADKSVVNINSVIDTTGTHSGTISATNREDCSEANHDEVLTYQKYPDLMVNNIKNGDGYIEVRSTATILNISVQAKYWDLDVKIKYADDESSEFVSHQLLATYSTSNLPKLEMRKISIQMESTNGDINYETHRYVKLYPYSILMWASKQYQAYPGESLMLCSVLSMTNMQWYVTIDRVKYKLKKTPSFIRWISGTMCLFIEVQEEHSQYTFSINRYLNPASEANSFEIKIQQPPFTVRLNRDDTSKTVTCSLAFQNDDHKSNIKKINVYPLMNSFIPSTMNQDSTEASYSTAETESLPSQVSVCQIYFTKPGTTDHFLVHIKSENIVSVPAPPAEITVAPNRIQETKQITITCTISDVSDDAQGKISIFSKTPSVDTEVIRRLEGMYSSTQKEISLMIPHAEKNVDSHYYCMVKSNENVHFVASKVVTILDKPRINIRLEGQLAKNEEIKIICSLENMIPDDSKWGYSVPHSSTSIKSFDSGNYVMTINSFSEIHQGEYKCTYSDSDWPDLITDPIYLYIAGSVIMDSRIDQTEVTMHNPENSVATLTNFVTNLNDYSIKFEWHKMNGDVLSSVTCTAYTPQAKPQICIAQHNVTYQNLLLENQYRNVWYKSTDSNNQNTILQVTVQRFVKPTISGFKNKIDFNEPDQMSITCTITGPINKISWFKQQEGAQTTLVSNEEVVANFGEPPQTKDLVLTILRKDTQKGDIYTCEGQTTYGVFRELTLTTRMSTEIYFDYTKTIIIVVVASVAATILVLVIALCVIKRLK